MRAAPLSVIVVWMVACVAVAITVGAVPNGSFVATWDTPTDSSAIYEFRWKHFVRGDWQPLPDQDARARRFTYTYPKLPDTPATDRWLCLDARSRLGDLVSAWLSETDTGAACNTVEVGVIIIPPPPVVVPPPPVVIPPAPPILPAEIFSNVMNSNGVLSFTYKPVDCSRGVQPRTSAKAMNGQKTVTLTCRR